MKRSSLSNSHSSNARGASLVSPSSALAAVILLVACESPQPPALCTTLEDHTMFVRQDRTVMPCFEDPEMGEITLSAESSDAEIVTAAMVGDQVRIAAISVGTAIITVIATDPDLLSASASFTVQVPNRPPWGHRRMPDAQFFPGGTSARLASRYFADPDDQELTYSAMSSDRAVVSTSQSGDTVTLHARGEGSATVTVTATDPFGETAAQEATATVTSPILLLRDDFDTDGSLSNWEVGSNSDATVAQGQLRLYNVVAGLPGWIETDVVADVWEASASMGNATDSVFVGLVAGTVHSRYPTYLIQIGMDDDTFTDFGQTNYRFLVWDTDGPNWTYSEGWYGQSPAIADVGDLTEITLSAQGGHLTVHAGSTELIRVDLEGNGLSGQLTYLALATWPKCCETGHEGVVDWIELKGIAVGGLSAEGRRTPVGQTNWLPEVRFGNGIRSETVREFKPGKPVLRASNRRK